MNRTGRKRSKGKAGADPNADRRMATRAEQIERLVDGLTASGYAVVNDYRPRDRPAILDIVGKDDAATLRVFCWNVTSGGRGRAVDEYRVQTTRPGQVPLFQPGAHVNLVLGFEEARDLFVAWDAEKHLNPGGSSSLQVPLDMLEAAAISGFESRARPLAGDEIEVVVALRPELIGEYLEIRGDLDASSREEGAASAAAASGNEEEALEELPAGSERRRVVASISRVVRNAQIRLRVLRAYGGRCAVCDRGATLTEAAHVRSVQAGGEDLVRNGIAFCPTHHAAFDIGLIVVDEDLRVSINERRALDLALTNEDWDRLKHGLRERLREPEPLDLRPSAENISAHLERWT
jgi:putative restriction endonuclease